MSACLGQVCSFVDMYNYSSIILHNSEEIKGFIGNSFAGD